VAAEKRYDDDICGYCRYGGYVPGRGGYKIEVLLRNAFQLVFSSQRSDLVLEACRQLVHAYTGYLIDTEDCVYQVVPTAVRAALETGNLAFVPMVWDAICNEKEDRSFSSFESKKCDILQKVANTRMANLSPDMLRQSREGEACGARVIEDWMVSVLKNGDSEFLHNGSFLCSRMTTDDSLTGWLCKQGLPHLALVLSVERKNKKVIVNVLKQFSQSIVEKLLKQCISHLIDDLREWSCAAAFLSLIPCGTLSKESVFVHYGDGVNSRQNPKPLLSALKKAGATGWAIGLCVESKKWDKVRQLMPSCHDAVVAGWVLDYASVDKQWDLCRMYMKRCTDEHVLRKVFNKAIKTCSKDVSLSEIISYAADHLDFTPSGSYSDAGFSCNQSNHVLKALVSIGLSTFVRSEYTAHSLLASTVRDFDLDMLKILHRAGIWTNKVLHRFDLSREEVLRTSHSEKSEEEKEAVRAYARQMSEQPLSLQDLSRLAVSHRLGVKPGRSQRIESLPVPSIIKKLVSFADLVGVDGAC
jgi:hypothetical protein